MSNKKRIKRRRERGYVKEALRLGRAARPGYHDLCVFHDDWCATAASVFTIARPRRKRVSLAIAVPRQNVPHSSVLA